MMTCEDDSKDFSWIGKLAKRFVDHAIEEQRKEKEMIEEQRAKREKTSLLDDLKQQSQQQSRDKDVHVETRGSPPKGPWIVILPSSTNALITMYNAKQFFGEGVFQPSLDLRSKGKEAMIRCHIPKHTIPSNS